MRYLTDYFSANKKNKQMSYESYRADPTLTLGELWDILGERIKKFGRNVQVRVDESYDQGQPAVGISLVEEELYDGYIAIVA